MLVVGVLKTPVKTFHSVLDKVTRTRPVTGASMGQVYRFLEVGKGLNQGFP